MGHEPTTLTYDPLCHKKPIRLNHGFNNPRVSHEYMNQSLLCAENPNVFPFGALGPTFPFPSTAQGFLPLVERAKLHRGRERGFLFSAHIGASHACYSVRSKLLLDFPVSFAFISEVCPAQWCGGPGEMPVENTQVIETGHNDVIHDVQMDYYGKRLATCSSDRVIKVFAVVGDNHSLLAELLGARRNLLPLLWSTTFVLLVYRCTRVPALLRGLQPRCIRRSPIAFLKWFLMSCPPG